MNVELSKEEYANLLDLLYIADSVITWHKSDDDARARKYGRIVQKFYDFAPQMGMPDAIRYDRDLRKYLPTEAYRESSEARLLLDDFAEETFWHELIARFTERDLERRAGGYEKMLELAPDKRFDLETPIEERYIEEFTENGIERLEIVEHFGAIEQKRKTSD